MGFLNRLFGIEEKGNEIENLVEKEIDITQNTVLNILDDDEDNSRGRVTEDKAMQIPALASGVDIIASSIAYLPIKLYKTNKDGEKEEVKDDYRTKLLNVSNNSFDSAFNMKYGQVKSLILHGTSYTFISKNGKNKIESLYYLNKNDVTPQLIKVGNGYDYKFNFTLFQDFKEVTSDEMMVASKDVARSTDLEGIGILKKGERILKLALNELETSTSSLENQLNGYLSTQNALSPEAKKNIRSSFKGLQSSKQIPILEEGLEYKTVSAMKPEELELIGSRKFTTEQIAQLLNIPFTYLLASASSYNTSAEESIRFLKIALMPYIVVLEQAYQRFLLTSREIEQGYYFAFDTSQILKISSQEMANYLKSLKSSGMISANEARRELGMRSVQGGDYLEIPVNTYQLVDGKITLPSLEQGNTNAEEVAVEEEPKEDTMEE